MAVWLSHCRKARFQASVLSEWTLHVANVFVLVSSHSPKTCKSGGLQTTNSNASVYHLWLLSHQTKI